MRILPLCVILVGFYVALADLAKSRDIIYVAGLLSVTQNGNEIGEGRGVLPAVELALRHVNSNPEVLPKHKLEVIQSDTKCDMAEGTKIFFDMMHFQPEKAILFGDACTEVVKPLAESSKWWNIWQLSYADTNPVLSSRKDYPNFFRTVPSDSDYNPARLALLRHFNWSIVGTVFQDASKASSRYEEAHNKLTALLDNSGINRETESFSSDPKPALTNLKERDIRIIIGNFDEAMARRVFCSAYEEKMFGPKYAWFILGDYSAGWWREVEPDLPCSPEQIAEALNGYISTGLLETSTDNVVTLAGYTPDEYIGLYNRDRGGHYSKFHGYAYDGIWTIATALDKIIKEDDGQKVNKHFRSWRIAEALKSTNFYGVTGRVVFNDGDRVGGVLYQQFTQGELRKVAEYNSHNSSIKFYNQFHWEGIGPPRDSSERTTVLYKVQLSIYVPMCILAGLGILLAVCFFVFNIIYRNHRYIKMSSPNMNNLIIAGSMLAYVSVFLLGTDGGPIPHRFYAYICYARTWTICIAFTLAFGAMFSKTWRVHAIFTNIKLNKKVIKDYQLFLVVLVLLSIDCTLLWAWVILDPMSRGEERLMPEIDRSGRDKEIIFILEYCRSEYMHIWQAVLYAFKGLLLLVGSFLAWETRQVSIPALNDSKYIGMSVYNVVITCVAGVAVSFVVKDQPDSGFLIIALFIIFCTTITLCLVFVPKVIELKKDPHGDERRIRATLRKSISIAAPCDNHDHELSDKIRELSEENIKYRKILEDKKREIEELLVELGESPYEYEDEELPLQHNCVQTPLLYTERKSQDDQYSLISNSSGAPVWSPDDHVIHPDHHTHNRIREHIELSDIKEASSEQMKSYEGLKELTATNFCQLKETDILSQNEIDQVPAEHCFGANNTDARANLLAYKL